MVVAKFNSTMVITVKETSSSDEHSQFLQSPISDVMKKKKEKHCCHAETYRLVDYHSLPNFLKHNEFVINYYRSEWPLKESLLSIFSLHNETINIWTHLIGFLVFLSLTVCTVMAFQMDSTMPNSSAPANSTAAFGLPPNLNININISTNTANVTNLHSVNIQVQIPSSNMNGQESKNAAGHQTPRWPFYAYLCGAMFCLLMSSACHLLSCHSEHTCYLMLRLDYAGIAALIVTSFYPPVYYSFMCDPTVQFIYLSSITLFGAATIVVSLLPAFETPGFLMVRTGLFVCMGLSGVVPLVHKMLSFGDRPEAVLTTGYELIMGACYGLGVVAYATRVPERWLPGKFDLAGHSHQLFHIMVIAGAYTHYLAGLVYLRWRDMDACF